MEEYSVMMVLALEIGDIAGHRIAAAGALAIGLSLLDLVHLQ